MASLPKGFSTMRWLQNVAKMKNDTLDIENKKARLESQVSVTHKHPQECERW